AVKVKGNAALGHDTGELLEEIDVEVGAPELPVGDAGQAQVLLEADDVTDRGVLDSPERFPRNFALPAPLACIEQLGRAKKAADVIGAERRLRTGGHRPSPFSLTSHAIDDRPRGGCQARTVVDRELRSAIDPVCAQTAECAMISRLRSSRSKLL